MACIIAKTVNHVLAQSVNYLTTLYSTPALLAACLGALFPAGSRFQAHPDAVSIIIISLWSHQLHSFLNHRVADEFELRILYQRDPLREVIRVRSQDLLLLFVPQIIELFDLAVPSKFRDDLVDDGFGFGLEVAVDLLSGGTGQPIGKLY